MATTNISSSGVLGFNDTTGAVQLPSGTTAQRPGSPSNGEMRYNTTDNKVEYYDGASWIQLTDSNADAYNVDFLVVAGGGAGGGDRDFRTGTGGGGAGGLRTSYGSTSGGGSSAQSPAEFVIGTTYTITIGAGGYDRYQNTPIAGNDSEISGSGLTTINTTRGGWGAGFYGGNRYYYEAQSGGSGGGTLNATPLSGTADEGFQGGTDTGGQGFACGGGAASAGTATVSGSGLNVNIISTSNATTSSVGEVSGSDVYFAGGGGGNGQLGGIGGGADGGTSSSPNGGSSPANTGGGGGGCYSTYSTQYTGGSGGSGIIILRILTSKYTGTTTGSPDVYTEGSDTVLVYKGSGTYTA